MVGKPAPPTLNLEVAEFSPGLEGVVAAETAVSEVDGANGRLIYRGGYLIEDLVPVVSFEEAAYLLWHGDLPNESQLDSLREQMATARTLNKSARGTLTAMDAATEPMDVLRTVVSAQGAAKTLTKPTLEEAVALTAIFPTIVGATNRRRQGRDIVEPRADLGHAANLLWMMSGEEPAAEKVHLVDTYLVLLADHGLNASTFAARVVASTGSDLTSCVVGAIAALKGPAHGGATLAARNMLDKIGSAENAEKWLREAHARHERFAGFGHRVYRTYDPRAKILREMAKNAAPDLHRTAARTEELALAILHEAHPERPNATNVDFWASVVLTGAGIPKELFTTVFATSRVSGWTAHVLESLSDLRIIRPASRWIGPEPGKKPLQLAKR
ncbi:MAG: citrate/2-methylcitrate synthase [Chloroflexi bacterium]|nr:MAG: citrate/2-methylcitrate synthase [Chloroflexota bacterium]TMD71106.1 MAG: citrate/2-methylcitrate synthase [Chloroflexota bacterium]